MKICEYEKVTCPYCQEEDELQDVGNVTLNKPSIPSASLGPWHFITCKACGGDFCIPCAD